MSNIKFITGNTEQNNAHTGIAGSITVDIEAYTLRLHDGMTPGGYMLVTDDALTQGLNGKANTLHTHAMSSISGLNDALGDKVDTGDSRLTDPREWTGVTVEQSEAEAGTATTRRAWTAQRVRQAIAAFTQVFTPAEKTKLGGIATGATANATNAQLRDRDTHTGTQPISSVTNLQTSLNDRPSTGSAASFSSVTTTGSTVSLTNGGGSLDVVDNSSTILYRFGSGGTFHSAGNVQAYSSTIGSDERLKEDWVGFGDDFVDRLAGVKAGEYTRIDQPGRPRQSGVSAQDLQAVLRTEVMEGEWLDERYQGYLVVNYGNAAMVSAVELAKMVVALRDRVEQLEKRSI